ncbi:MAG TPA: hypothetical protein VFE07_14945 [Marmoricola sp.]|nr:hypothetical protein [Marmoricola sp.]
MSHDAPGPRPPQVTIGGWVVAVASAVLVVTVFDAMTHLHSVDTRDSVRHALSSGSAQGLGISVDQAIGVIRAALLVAGAAAAMTAVLGVFVLQRHLAARVVLSIAAVPIALSAVIGGGGRSGSAEGVFLLGIVIAAATPLLWTEPARDWFAGRSPQPKVAVAAGSTWPPPARTELAPIEVRLVTVLSAPAPSGRVPISVRVACILTWVFCALTGLVYVGLIVAAGVDRHGTVDLVRDSAGISDFSTSDAEVVGILLAMCASMLVWCILASVVAALAWHRQAWASVVLIVSCGVATLFEVVALPFSVLHVAASVAAFVLLLRPSARAWFRRTVPVATARDWPAPSGPPLPPAEHESPPSGKPPVW